MLLVGDWGHSVRGEATHHTLATLALQSEELSMEFVIKDIIHI